MKSGNWYWKNLTKVGAEKILDRFNLIKSNGNVMKELWIHAGMPKNGSSALQVFLARNRETLLKESLDYIELSDISDAKKGKISSGNGALLARSMLPENHESFYADNDNLYSSLLSYIENTKSSKYIISSEFFAVVPIEKIRALKEDLDRNNVGIKYLYYVRRQDQFLMSSYMQRVKRHGYSGFPDEFIRESFKNIHFLNYYGYAKQYADMLGKENLHAFIYEYTRTHRKGLVGHFIESILGYLPEWIENIKSVNTSPSPLELKFMLASNQYSPRMKYSDFLIEDSIYRGNSLEYKNHKIISDDLINEVMSYFDVQNQKFFDEFSGGDCFPKIEKNEFIDLKKLSFSPNEVIDVISGFLVRYDRRLTILESLLKKKL